MRDYSLNKDVEAKEKTNEDNWETWEPKHIVEIDNLRLDPEAAARYREVRKARERKNTGSRNKKD